MLENSAEPSKEYVQSISERLDRSAGAVIGFVTAASTNIQTGSSNSIQSLVDVLADQRPSVRIDLISVQSDQNQLRSNENELVWDPKQGNQTITNRLVLAQKNRDTVFIDLGGMNAPWVESVGRLCDEVHLTIPKRRHANKSETIRRLKQLRYAGLQISGCWIAEE